MSGSIAQLFEQFLSNFDSGTELSRITAQAKKLLGKNSDIPEPPFDVKQIATRVAQSKKDVATHSLEFRKLILQIQNAYTVAFNDLSDYQNQIAASDFGLDANNKASAEKIAKVHQVFHSYFTDYIGVQKAGLEVTRWMMRELIPD